MATRTRAAGRRAKQPARSAYHHGDLHTALLDAADQLLDERGIEGMSLRECARRAGVSHAAPAHHFGDLTGLLTALCARYYQQFGHCLEHARATTNGEPFDRLVAIGLAYFAFAAERPARFRLMFRSERLDPERMTAPQDDGAYDVLLTCIGETDAASGGDGSNVQVKALLAHTLVHGFATLVLDNPAFPGGPREDAPARLALLDAALRIARPAFENPGSAAPARRTRAKSRTPVTGKT